MTEAPDLSTLRGRADYASKVIDEVNERLRTSPAILDATWPGPAERSGRAPAWNGADLRRYALQIGYEDDWSAYQGELVEGLARDLYYLRIQLTSWDFASKSTKDSLRAHARDLIARDWHKDGAS